MNFLVAGLAPILFWRPLVALIDSQRPEGRDRVPWDSGISLLILPKARAESASDLERVGCASDAKAHGQQLGFHGSTRMSKSQCSKGIPSFS
jgi:hypothetical protein